MATSFSSYSTSTTKSTTSTLITSHTGLNTAKNLINKTNNNLNHQFISPMNNTTTRYIKNNYTSSITTSNQQHNQHASLKMQQNSIVRCKPTRLNRFVIETTPSAKDLSRIERNYSYIEAMKEPKSLPSSSSSPSSSTSSSSSTIESPIIETCPIKSPLDLAEEVEIPIEINLNQTAPNTNLSKSRSQSSIFSLFKNTFSPFQIRKWRSKSRDKLLLNNSLNSTPVTNNNITTNNTNSSAPTQTNKSNNYNNIYIKNNKLATKVSLPLKNELSNEAKIILLNKTNTASSNSSNFSYSSSISNESSCESSTSCSSSETSSNNNNKATKQNNNNLLLTPNPAVTRSPNSGRQLSYLKLTCLLNGYDQTSEQTSKPEIKSQFEKENQSEFITKTTNLSLNLNLTHDKLVSSKTILNNTERYYDLKPTNFINIIKKPQHIEQKQKETHSTTNNNNNFNNINCNTNDKMNQTKQENIEKTSNISNRNSLLSNTNENSVVNESEIVLAPFVTELNIKSLVKQIEEDELNLAGMEPIKMTTNNIELENKNQEQLENNNINQEIEREQQQVVQDGHYYIKLLDDSTNHINELCKLYQPYTDETNENFVRNEEALGQIQTTIGKGQLLINQKFKQFRGLCLKNISDKTNTAPLKEGEFVTRDDDLAGFWDMVYLQVEDIDKMFSKLSELKKNNWIIEAKEQKTNAKPVVKKKTPVTGTTTTAGSTATSKARADAAKQRILEAKKAALAKQKEQNISNDLNIIN